MHYLKVFYLNCRFTWGAFMSSIFIYSPWLPWLYLMLSVNEQQYWNPINQHQRESEWDSPVQEAVPLSVSWSCECCWWRTGSSHLVFCWGWFSSVDLRCLEKQLEAQTESMSVARPELDTLHECKITTCTCQFYALFCWRLNFWRPDNSKTGSPLNSKTGESKPICSALIAVLLYEIPM